MRGRLSRIFASLHPGYDQNARTIEDNMKDDSCDVIVIGGG